MAEASIVQPESIGRYEITERLGGGGFGDVYRAYDASIPRHVAIKCLRRPDDPELLRLFRNEAAAAGNMVHENVVTVYDFGEADGVPYLVMELLDGEDLGDILARGERLSLHESVELMRQVAVGLHYAHEKEIVHRDIKPSNIRRQANGKVKLMDFGIARVSRAGTGQSTKTGAVVGTLRYMSPEQLAGERVDERSDIFSYGVVYYELITGKHPFDGATQTAMLYNIVHKQPLPLAELVPEAPAALGPLLERLLAKDRGERYQSLEEFLIDSELVVQEIRQERASTLVSEGSRAFATGDLAQAQRALRKALKLDPRNVPARELRERIRTEQHAREAAPQVREILSRAQELLAAERFEQAIAELEKAQAIDPTNASISAMASQAESRRSQSLLVAALCRDAEGALAQGQFDTALSHAAKAASLATGAERPQELLRRIRAEIDKTEQKRSFETRIREAHGLVSMGSYGEAEREVIQLQSEFPDREELDSLLARIRDERGRVSSRAELSAALAEAREHVREQRFQEAIHYLEPVQARFPDATEVGSLIEYARDSWREQESAREINRLLSAARGQANDRRYEQALHILGDASSTHAHDRRILDAIHEITRAQEASERYDAVKLAQQQVVTLRAQARRAEALQAIDRVVAAHGDEARKALDRVRQELVDEDATEHREAAVGRALKQAQSLLDQHELARARALVALAIRESGEDSRLLQMQAEIEHQGRLAEALAKIDRLTNEDRLDDAEAALNAARAEHPDDTRFETLAVRIGDARATYQQRRQLEELKIQIEPLLAEGAFDQALALLDAAGPLGRTADGEKLRRHVECARNLDAVWKQAEAALERRDTTRAAAVLDDAAQLFPNDDAFQEGLAKLRQRVHDDSEARGRLESEATQAYRAEGAARTARARSRSVPKWLWPAAAALATLALAAAGFLMFRGGGAVDVRVVTQPEGATVSIGDAECVTPNCAISLPPGSYAVDVRLAGYAPQAASLTIDPDGGASRELEYALDPIPQRLQIHTNFERGTVKLDDAPAVQLDDGQYQLPRLGEGGHLVTVSDGGAGRLSLRFRVANGQPAQLERIDTSGGVSALALATLGSRANAMSSEASGTIRVAGQAGSFTQDSPASFQGVEAGTQAIIYPSGGQQRQALAEFANFPLLALSLNTLSDAGILVVETPGVADAEVLLNGRAHSRRTGAGPLRIRLDAGEYRVEVRKPGYRGSPPQVVDLTPAGETRAAFTLEPLSTKASLAVRDAAPGTVIRLDGQELGRADADRTLSLGNIDPGQHTVALSLEGHKPKTERRDFTAGGTVTVSGVLETTRGTLRITLNPANTTVSLTREGTSQAQTVGPGEHQITEGRYRYRASASGYEEVTDTLEIVAGEALRLPIRLPEQRATGPGPDAELERAWQAARAANTVAAYQGFLAKHAGSPREPEARRAIGGLVWDSLDKNDLTALNKFRGDFPDPDLRGLAEREIERLQRAQKQSAGNAASEQLRNDRNAVYAALARYSSAFGNKDLEAVQAAWPGIPKASLEGLKRTFNERNVTLTMSLQPLADPEINGNTATLSCQISTSAIKNGRASSAPAKRANVVLSRAGQGWVIQDLKIEN